jgi:hypothetical protein
MAVSAEWTESVAKVTGILPATTHRVGRALREAKRDLYAAADRPGGGKNAAHLQPHHYANFLLGLAGAQPSDAPGVVDRLRPLRFLDAVRLPAGGDLFKVAPLQEKNPSGDQALRAWDLGTLIEKLIVVWAHLPDDQRADAREAHKRRGVRLILDPGQRRASLRETSDTGSVELLIFGVPEEDAHRMALADHLVAPEIPVDRETTIRSGLLFLAADMLARTPGWSAGELPFPPSGEASGNADDPESRNAAPGRAALTGEQARGNYAHPISDSAEGRGRKETSQPSFVLRACSPPVTLSTGARANGPPKPRGGSLTALPIPQRPYSPSPGPA